MNDTSIINSPPNRNGVYKKPIYYSLIHIFIGIVSVKYIQVGIVFVIYQLTQLILNKRFFVFQLKTKKGNSFTHTIYKLGEFFLGMIIGYTIL